MAEQQGQSQDAQNALQEEFPANTNARTNNVTSASVGDDAQTEQRAESWRPSEDPAIEQAGGITEPVEEQPKHDQAADNSRGAGDDVERAAG